MYVTCLMSSCLLFTPLQIIWNKLHNLLTKSRHGKGLQFVMKYVQREIKACPDSAFLTAKTPHTTDPSTPSLATQSLNLADSSTSSLSAESLVQDYTPRASRSKNPFHRALMSRAPCALNLWADANKELVDERSQGMQFANIGERRAFTARLYEQQSADIHDQYTHLAAAKAKEMKNCPDAVWQYVHAHYAWIAR